MFFETTANADIKRLAKEKNVSFSELAKAYKVTEESFLKAINKELPTNTKEHMVKTINRISAVQRKE